MNAPTRVGALAMISTTLESSMPNKSSGSSDKKFEFNKPLPFGL